MGSRLKFVIDENIPFINGVFEKYADVVYKNGAQIVHEDLVDADALIIRNRTKCDEALLKDTSLKIISTATIGIDHIDVEYCNSHGIITHYAEGSNSGGVLQYVFSALYGTAARNSINLVGKTIGIVGAGNVGRKVNDLAKFLGFNVLLNDPFRAEVESDGEFVSLDYLLENSDIVTLHVPLNASTYHLANQEFFFKMKTGAFFINSARGGIVDEQALINAIPKLGPVIIDTWANEPDVNRSLLELVDIATPHIAGYSFQGKMNATSMSVQAIAHYFGIIELYYFYPDYDGKDIEPQKLDLVGKTQGQVAALFQYNYPIFTDDFIFRMNPEKFEYIRENYNYRREIIYKL